MPSTKQFEYKYPNEGRWDQGRGRWVTPKEDFEILRLNNPSPVTKKQQLKNYRDLAKEDVPGISQFCKFILSGVDPLQIGPQSPGKAPLVRLNGTMATRVA